MSYPQGHCHQTSYPSPIISPGRQGRSNALLADVSIEEVFGEFIEGTLLDSEPPPTGSKLNPQFVASDYFDGPLPVAAVDSDADLDDEEDALPDVVEIQRKVDRYYPYLVGRYVPASRLALQCATVGCIQEQGDYYACMTCCSGRWFCRDCMVARHRNNPYHHVEKWDTTKGCKTAVSLADMGLVLELDHSNGFPCNLPIERDVAIENLRSLQVLHTNGVHQVVYHCCGCEGAGHATAAPEQLLANGLFPATDKQPNRAFTFELLHQYDILDLSGYINTKQYLDGILELSPLANTVCHPFQAKMLVIL